VAARVHLPGGQVSDDLPAVAEDAQGVVVLGALQVGVDQVVERVHVVVGVAARTLGLGGDQVALDRLRPAGDAPVRHGAAGMGSGHRRERLVRLEVPEGMEQRQRPAERRLHGLVSLNPAAGLPPPLIRPHREACWP
jgi:hypothetical protein